MHVKKTADLFDKLIKGLWVLSGAMLLFCVFSITTDVILRTVSSGISLPWVVEVNEYALFGITFFASAWCLKTDGHIRIDFIYGLFSERSQTLLSFLSSILSSITCLVFGYCALLASLSSYEQGSRLFKYLRVPKYVFTLVICLGSVLLTVEFLRQAYRCFRRWESRKERIAA